MADLFAEPGAPAPAHKAAPAQLHSDTELYRAIVELNRYIARTTSHFRRDIKPTYGVLLVDESLRMNVVLREANIARDAAKLPYLNELLRQTEYIQFGLRLLDSLGADWLPHTTYSDSLKLTALIARQATGLRNHFAPAP